MRSSTRLLQLICCLLAALQVGAFSALPASSTAAGSSRHLVSVTPLQLSISSSSIARVPSANRKDYNMRILGRNRHQDDGTEMKIKWRASRMAGIVLLSTMTACFTLPQTSFAASLADISHLTGGAATTLASNTFSLFDTISQTGFYQAFSLVFLSEIGDKTFFIAGLLAMKTSRFVSYLGSMVALTAMTVLSVLIGQIFHAVPTGLAQGVPLDDVAAVIAFAFFGFRTLKEALDMDDDGTSFMDAELAEAEETVEESKISSKLSTAWAQAASIFALVFAAEFGDRSFLSTIALSAAQNPISVAGGAIVAHGVATGIAVSGGSFVARYISEKVVGVISGCLFLVFAVTTALGIF